MALTLEELKSFYNGKKVLVTGHTGFKGSWLVRILTLAGAQVTSSIETLLSKTQQSFSGSDLAGRMGPPPEYFSAGSRPTGPPKGRNGPAPLGRRPV